MCTSYRMGSTFRRAGSASRDYRPSRRRCATPSSQLPGSAFGAFRSAISWLPEKRHQGEAFFALGTVKCGLSPAVILTAYPPDFQRLCKMYQEVAAEAGYTRGLGEKVGVVRAVHFGRTEEEAVTLLRDT